MGKIFFTGLLIIFLSICLYGSDDEIIEDNYNPAGDSLTSIIDDYRHILTEDVIDTLLDMKRRGEMVSVLKLEHLTGNGYLARIIHASMFREEPGVNAKGIIYTDSIDLEESAVILRLSAKRSIFYSGILMEKDAGERNYLDNLKLAIDLSGRLTAGNYRIRTGKGLFSNYGTQFNFAGSSFYSVRNEPDLSKTEYPAFRGLMYSFPVGSSLLTLISSYNKYDSRLDSLGNTDRILQYNIHDDSLSSSRRDNLSEYTGGALYMSPTGYFNAGLMYSAYSRTVNALDARSNYIADIFGLCGDISYDLALSRTGYAGHIAMRRIFDKLRIYTGAAGNYNYYNTHSVLFSGSNFYSLYSRVSSSSIFPTYLTFEYIRRDNDYSFEAAAKLKPLKGLEMDVKIDPADTSYVMKLRHSSLSENGFLIRHSAIITNKGSYLIREDFNMEYSAYDLRLFGYLYSVQGDDVLSQYHYMVSEVYQHKNIYRGKGFTAGARIRIYASRSSFEISGLYNSENGIEGGCSLAIGI